MLDYLAMTLVCLGYIDQGRSRMDEALSEARRLRHAHTLAYVLTHQQLDSTGSLARPRRPIEELLDPNDRARFSTLFELGPCASADGH